MHAVETIGGAHDRQDRSGLELRVMLACVRIARIVGVESAASDFGDLYEEAMARGYRDAQVGICSPPFMFREEPDLVDAWDEGQGRYFVENLFHCDE